MLPAVCHGKSAATLRKHAGAMNLYMRWAHSHGTAPFPFREQIVWNYVAFLHDARAPATRADSFIRAAHVATTPLSLHSSASELDTVRISGAML